jgi:hypothetical protein
MSTSSIFKKRNKSTVYNRMSKQDCAEFKQVIREIVLSKFVPLFKQCYVDGDNIESSFPNWPNKDMCFLGLVMKHLI